MRKYIAPRMMYVELRAEERIATECTGSCTTEQANQWNEEECTDFYVALGS